MFLCGEKYKKNLFVFNDKLVTANQVLCFCSSLFTVPNKTLRGHIFVLIK